MKPSPNRKRDLIVLAADLDIRVTADTLLKHPKKLGIRQIQFDTLPHPRHDPGCLKHAAEFLRNFQESHRYALVIFDYHGTNSPYPRDRIQRQVEAQLHDNGWPDRAKVIVIDPELEAWVWTSSPITATTLGCQTTDELRSLLQKLELCPPDLTKPPHPKEAMKSICDLNRVNRSASLFREIASQATFRHCQDPAFLELRATLLDWFPVQNHHA